MLRFSCIAALLFLAGSEAYAGAVSIVAIGADNTAGRGIGRYRGGVDAAQAYPAQLEAMLRARGIDAHVSNEGIPRATTDQILARLDSSVPAGTQLTILNVARGNDAQRSTPADEQNAVNEIKKRLSARHVPLIILPPLEQVAGAYRDSDGRHFTAEGHTRIAAYLLPKVMSTLHLKPHRT